MTARAKTLVNHLVNRLQLLIGALELQQPILAAEALRDIRRDCDSIETEIKSEAERLLKGDLLDDQSVRA